MPITSDITVQPQAFAAAVAWAAKWTSAKPVVPVHGGVALTAASGWLTVGAFSENATARATLGALVAADSAPQRAIVSGRLLAELVATFGPGKPVVISGEGDAVVLTAGRFVATLPTLDEDAYPTLPGTLPVIGSVGGDDFAAAVRRVGAALDPEQEEVALRAMYLGLGAEGRLTLMSTSRSRAAIAEPAWSFNDEVLDETVLAAPYATPLGSVLIDAAAAFAGPDQVEIGCDGQVLSLTSPTRSLTMRLLDLRDNRGGLTFPLDQLRMAFGTEWPRAAVLDRSEMAMPLKRASIMRGKAGPVRITFAPGTLTIGAAEGETKRTGEDVIEVAYDGEPVTLGVNPDFFAEALKAAPGDTVRIAFSEPRRHLTLTCDADPTWCHVLMPVRIG